jgi:hypothetical protein
LIRSRIRSYAVNFGDRRILAAVAWIPELLLLLGLVVALDGDLRRDICPFINPPMRPASPCGDSASFGMLGDITAPGTSFAVLVVVAGLAIALWAMRGAVSATPALIGLSIASVLAIVIAMGTLPFAIGAIAVAALAGLSRRLT